MGRRDGEKEGLKSPLDRSGVQMTSRERVLAALNFREADRVAIQDDPWFTTVERWHREGLPEGKTAEQFFNYEMWSLGWDGSLRLPVKTVEETEEYAIVRNPDGALRKDWKHATSTPENIDFTITSKKLWEENRDRLVWSEERVNWEETRRVYDQARAEGKFIPFGAITGYDRAQGMVGSERLLVAMAEEPEWAKDMFARFVEITIEAHQAFVSHGFEIDGAFMYNDMGYRNASLFSPRMYRELLMPYDQRLFGYFNARGMKVILHSCGCIKELVPYLIEAGLGCLQPLEVKAGMDVLEMKRLYHGKLALMGGIDVRKMSSPDPSVIEQEIREKVGAAKVGGGYIYHSDHSVPDNVSFQQYQRVIELVKRYGEY